MIKQGEALSKAMAKYPKYFPLIISEQIKLAEETGALAEQLEYIAKSLKQSLEIKNNIIKAITYPGIMLGMSTILAMILLIRTYYIMFPNNIINSKISSYLVGPEHFFCFLIPC